MHIESNQWITLRIVRGNTNLSFVYAKRDGADGWILLNENTADWTTWEAENKPSLQFIAYEQNGKPIVTNSTTDAIYLDYFKIYSLACKMLFGVFVEVDCANTIDVIKLNWNIREYVKNIFDGC
jgi:hypothetical protein